MKIELVSLRTDVSAMKRKNLVIEKINESSSDIILFCGCSVIREDEIPTFQAQIINKKVFVLFEIKNTNRDVDVSRDNGLVVIRKGKIVNLFTNQLFATSQEINRNEALAERFIQELEDKRFLSVNGKNILILQCGELNIIKNLQSQGNQPIFRLEHRSDLQNRFNKILNKTDLIFNPIHSPMGNQGKMHRRREFLSSNKRCYFSVSQNGNFDISANCLQYAYYNGKQMVECNRDYGRDYQTRMFEI